MLQYSSLLLSIIVVFAYYKKDTAIHHEWLAVLCTSLINHTTMQVTNGRSVDIVVRYLDIFLCHVNSAHCVFRMVTAPRTVYNGKIIILNTILGIHLVYIYHFGLSTRNDLWHAAIHFIAVIVVLNTMMLEYPYPYAYTSPSLLSTD